MINFFGYAFILIFTFVSFFVLVSFIIQANSLYQATLRFFAAGLGFLVYFAARTLNIELSRVIFEFIDPSGGALSNIIAMVAPFAFAAIFTYVIFNQIGIMGKENERSIYLIIIVIGVIAFISMDAFLGSMNSNIDNKNLLSNASLVGGIVMVMLFGFDVTPIFRKLFTNKDHNTKSNSNDDKDNTRAKHDEWRDKI